jgi:hypothetical protein
MITLCWSAKGGSGTTTVTAILALTARRPALLVDLDGEAHAALGLPTPTGPGVLDWLASGAPPEHLADLLVDVADGLALLPEPSAHRDTAEPRHQHDADRWTELGTWLEGWSERRAGNVFVDAGTGEPPPGLAEHCTHSLLVTRGCYLSLTRAARLGTRPTGVVLVAEPGRALRAADVERSAGAPVVATVDVDPAVARALDSGLLASRIPRAVRRGLDRAAA